MQNISIGLHVTLECGDFECQLVDVKERDVRPQGSVLHWTFRTELGGKSAYLVGHTLNQFEPESPERVWCEALMGRELGEKEPNLSSLIGRRCMLSVHLAACGRGDGPLRTVVSNAEPLPRR